MPQEIGSRSSQIFHVLRHTIEQRSSESDDVFTMDFADQHRLNVTDSFKASLPSPYQIGGEDEVVIKDESTVDNVAETQDTIYFTFNDKDYMLSQYLGEKPQFDYRLRVEDGGKWTEIYEIAQ